MVDSVGQRNLRYCEGALLSRTRAGRTSEAVALTAGSDLVRTVLLLSLQILAAEVPARTICSDPQKCFIYPRHGELAVTSAVLL